MKSAGTDRRYDATISVGGGNATVTVGQNSWSSKLGVNFAVGCVAWYLLAVLLGALPVALLCVLLGALLGVNCAVASPVFALITDNPRFT